MLKNDRASLPILVVDDDAVVLRTLSQMLSHNGYSVVTAGNVQEAMTIFEKREFLMVFTDIVMPGMDGLAFQKWIRIRRPELPVVIVTGEPTVDRAVEALRGGAANFIRKPFSAEQILDTVERGAAAVDKTVVLFDPRAFVLNQVIMQIPSDLAVVIGAVHFVCQRTLLADYYPRETVHQIRLALHEALTNAVRHGNRHSPLRSVRIDATVGAERFEVSVEDEGEGFDAAAVTNPLTATGIEATGGRGLFLIRCYMDGVVHNARGNRIRMWKNHPGLPATSTSQPAIASKPVAAM